MMFCDIITGAKITWQEVIHRAKEENPNRSLTISKKTVDVVQLQSYGVAIIEATEPPSVPDCCTVIEGDPVNIEGVWTQTWDIVEPTLAVAQRYQRGVILQAYEQEKVKPVYALGHNWKGGFSSAQGIEGLARMIEEVGDTEVVLQPVGEEPVTVTIAEAKQIAIAVAQAYQPIYMQKEARLRAVAASETAAEALAVTWDDPA